jgi:hypothetical protein
MKKACSMTITKVVLAVATVAALGIVARTPAAAAPLPLTPLAAQSADPLMIEVQRRFGGRGYGGPRYYGGGPRFARPVGVWRPRRPYVIGPGYRVARPWWRPGTAVAVGAAIGFVGAASVVAWAGQPPGPGYCWFYTDPSYRSGFWDICPP